MVRKLTLPLSVALAGLLLGGGIGCTTTEEYGNTPGALPTSHSSDVAPRLNAATYVAHGHLLERQGNFDGAVTQYRSALELTPTLTAARNRLGVTLNKLGLHAEATEEFRTATAQKPNSAQLHNNLGFSLYLEERYEEAEDAFARALELDPMFRRARMNHGLILVKLDQIEDALTNFRLVGSEVDARYNVALVLTDSGRYVDAAHQLEIALNENPDFGPARQQLRQISRLAATEELAALEQALATTEMVQAEEQAVDWAPTPTPTPTPASTVHLAADVDTLVLEPVPVPTPPAPAEPVTADEPAERPEDDPEPLDAQFHAEITRWLAAAEHLANMPESSAAWEAAETNRLMALFDELIDAMLLDAPWYETVLCRIEERLGWHD